MVRKGTIMLGVGATVAVGSIGLLAFHLRNNHLRAATVPADEDGAVATLVEAAAAPMQQNATAAVAEVAAPAPIDPVAAVLKGNAALLDEQDRALVAQLLELDQGHLFEGWPEPGTDDASKRRLLSQLRVLDASYHGGIAAYVRNARKLLQESRDGVNPFEGYVPSVPSGAILDYASPEFLELEGEGLAQAISAAFVLVAGGLGERLGYSGIKVALPCECASSTPFLGLYIASILALQSRAGPGARLPLAIMTSDDTHGRTVELLRRNNYFGMEEDQITLLKQEKVACLTDNSAHLALEPSDRWAVQTKPHGHGDVHMLLAGSGLARKWMREGLKWVCFFQDTNALVFRALLAALGVSSRHDFDMNSLAVPRKAREAIGAISRLTRPDGSAPLTINVEYNQLDPLLRSTISKEGDVNDQSGYSPFPGNINQLVLKLSSYVPQLEATGGVISEFVNPKYKDASKTAFKSSTRLECMMQDYPKALPSTANVGFTTIKQVWATYSPVKNSPADAAAKFKEGNPTHSATTGELDIYKANCLSLAAVAGMALPAPLQTATFNGITTELYPRVVLSPSFAPSLTELKSKVAPGSITLTPGSVLVLDGPGIRVTGPLVVRGALVVRAAAGAEVELGALTVDNAGWEWQPLAEGEAASEEERIRGFRVVRRKTMELHFDTPGGYTVPEEEEGEEEEEPQAQEAPAAQAEPSQAPAVEVAAAPLEEEEAPKEVEAAPSAAASEAFPAPPDAAKAAEAAEAVAAAETDAAAAEAAEAAAATETDTAAEVAAEADAVETDAAAAEAAEAAAATETDAAAEEAVEAEAAADESDEAAADADLAEAPAVPAPAAAASSRGGVVAAAVASSSGLSPDAKPFVPGASSMSSGGGGATGSATSSPGSTKAPSSSSVAPSSKSAKKRAKKKAAAAANGAKA